MFPFPKKEISPHYAEIKSRIEREREMRSGILSLKHGSRILRYCWELGCIKSKYCLSIRFGGVACPPAQCSKTDLKILNIEESYFGALEQGCLDERWERTCFQKEDISRPISLCPVCKTIAGKGETERGFWWAPPPYICLFMKGICPAINLWKEISFICRAMALIAMANRYPFLSPPSIDRSRSPLGDCLHWPQKCRAEDEEEGGKVSLGKVFSNFLNSPLSTKQCEVAVIMVFSDYLWIIGLTPEGRWKWSRWDLDHS